MMYRVQCIAAGSRRSSTHCHYSEGTLSEPVWVLQACELINIRRQGELALSSMRLWMLLP